jgi:hypothetical protein
MDVDAHKFINVESNQFASHWEKKKKKKFFLSQAS